MRQSLAIRRNHTPYKNSSCSSNNNFILLFIDTEIGALGRLFMFFTSFQKIKIPIHDVLLSCFCVTLLIYVYFSFYAYTGLSCMVYSAFLLIFPILFLQCIGSMSVIQCNAGNKTKILSYVLLFRK